MSFTISAPLAQAPEPDRLELQERAVIEVDDRGVITAVERGGSEAAARLAAGSRARGTHVEAPADALLIPGLVDTHNHAPQWPQLGTGLDMPLERWLFEHTFPLEARFSDLGFARPIWADLVAGLLAHGTTTAVYFASQDTAATTALAEAAADGGQRAYVGRVAMDHPDGTPPYYRDADAPAGIEASARSIAEIRAVDAGRRLVEPIITPRFTPACTDELLRGLGRLAAAEDVLVQTHCSESDWAHRYNLERYGVTDATALDGFGLLRRGTVLAHANHVTAADATRIAARSAGIAHCPLSNAYFANAVLPVRRLVAAGVLMGLGTDVAGGASPSLLHTAHEAVTASRVLEDGVDPARASGADRGVPGSRIDTTFAFWLATKGGADLLGAPVGLLVPGRRFDAVLVDTASRRGSLRTWPGIDNAERVLEKVVRLASPPDILDVWVDGRRVAGSRAEA